MSTLERAGDQYSIHVLHVDDEPDLGSLVATFLHQEDASMRIATETSPASALDYLEAHEVDCIISDYDMPGQNGIEFLKTVRNTHPELPFILFTGKGSEEIASEAISAGVTDYLQKEYGTDQYTLLANRVRNAVERYQFSQDAAETRTQLRAIAEHSADAILLIDAESRIRFANPAVESHFGYTPTELMGEPLTTIMPVRYHEAHHAALERYLETGERTLDWTNIEFPALHRNGSERPFSISYSEFDQHGEQMFIGILRDITERTQMESALRKREHQLRDTASHLEALFDHSPDLINILDGAGSIREVNNRFCEELGYEEDALIGTPIWEIDTTVTPEDVDCILGGLESGDRQKFDAAYQRADGTTTPVEVHLLRLNLDGADRYMAISRDITERKQYEATLTALHDTAQQILSANTPEDVAQYIVDTVHDSLEMPINGVFLADDAETVLQPVAVSTHGEALVVDIPTFERGSSLAWQVFESGDSASYRDVSQVPGRLNPDTPIRSEIIVPIGSYGIIMIGSTEVGVFDDRDVSLVETIATHGETALDRMNRERELAESEARYRSLTEDVLDTSSIGTFILNAEFEIEWISEATEDYFGLNREAVLGADKRHLVQSQIKDIFEKPADFAETVLATYEDNSYVEEFECRVLPDDGQDERWLNHWSQPIESGIYAGGRIEHYTDISELKRREQELEAQNARLDEFASVVSHDLRNPLNVAQGRLALHREDCDAPELETIGRSLDRIQTLIEDLLMLARQGTAIDVIDAVALDELVGSCWSSVATADATLHNEASRALAADRSRLQQLIENLFRNSIEHGGDDVTVTVGELSNGFYIEDTGPGIPPNVRDHVLDMGYTTSSDGTGFGLSIANQIALAHNWTLHVLEGTTGGARFEIRDVEWI